ncbi:16S rRNA (guanine(527)-N(7))-methyltransferase RsmG [Pelagibacterales bacterium SAG-MED31]|nr:16S rRNA (guanine(527)-N(7))-methyltransferase RsmG [Pelagibacterales bacterium SAG-MED31]
MKKEEIVEKFGLTKFQVKQINIYIFELIEFNNHTNLIGRSTLQNIWERHIADCLQLSLFISEKKSKIFDLGTGGGLPGVLLSIIGYRNIFMIDSVGKKIDFVRGITKMLSLSAKTEKKRIEKLNIGKADLIVSRALAPLYKLLSYSLMHSNKNTTSLFLKGRNVYNEIAMAKKKFNFSFDTFKSLSSEDGVVLRIKNLKVKKTDE